MRRFFASALCAVGLSFGAAAVVLAAPVIEVRATGVITASASNEASAFGGTGALVGKTATLIHTLSYSPGTVTVGAATSASSVFDTLSVSVQIDALAAQVFNAAAGDSGTYTLQRLDLPTPASVDSQTTLAPGAAFLETLILVSSLSQNLFAGLDLQQDLSFTLPALGVDARFGGILYDLTNTVWDFLVDRPAGITVTVTGLPVTPLATPGAAWLLFLGVALLVLQRHRHAGFL